MLLRGCFLRNSEYALALVVYVGNESKIMKNAKKAPKKISNIMKKMNYMLYTVFAMQFIIIVTFASLSINWMKENPSTLDFFKYFFYIFKNYSLKKDTNFLRWFV